MGIKGYVDYQRREYCNDIQCVIQKDLNAQQPDSTEYEQLREKCISDCIHSTYEFHHWLIKKDYQIVRPEK